MKKRPPAFLVILLLTVNGWVMGQPGKTTAKNPGEHRFEMLDKPYSWIRKKYELQRTKYKRKWEGQSSKEEQQPARSKLCTSSFVPRTLNYTTFTY